MTKLEEILQKEEFNIQDIAFITKRETQTIRSWEKKGIIPQADDRAESIGKLPGWRKYSKQRAIEVLERILNHPWQRQVIKNVDEVKYVIDVLKNNEEVSNG